MAKARRDLMKMAGLLLTLAVLTEWTALAQVSGESNSSCARPAHITYSALCRNPASIEPKDGYLYSSLSSWRAA